MKKEHAEHLAAHLRDKMVERARRDSGYFKNLVVDSPSVKLSQEMSVEAFSLSESASNKTVPQREESEGAWGIKITYVGESDRPTKDMEILEMAYEAAEEIRRGYVADKLWEAPGLVRNEVHFHRLDIDRFAGMAGIPSHLSR
ncbi:MAG: hypothetical protein SFX19_06630 [Alphaproteobacteria bacterium]|nr:hypothetical protein [Alphaproteobacteria bacterium]